MMQKAMQVESFDLNNLMEFKAELKKSTKLCRHFISTPLGTSVNVWCTARISFLQKHKWHFESIAKLVHESKSEATSAAFRSGKLAIVMALMTNMGKELTAVLEQMEDKSGVQEEVKIINEALSSGFATVVSIRASDLNSAVVALLKDPIAKLSPVKEQKFTEESAKQLHNGLTTGFENLIIAQNNMASVEGFADDEQKQWWLIQKQSVRAILSGLKWLVPLRHARWLPDEAPAPEDFGDITRLVTEFKTQDSLKMVLQPNGDIIEAELKVKHSLLMQWTAVVEVMSNGLTGVFTTHREALLTDPQVTACLLVVLQFVKRSEDDSGPKSLDVFALPALLQNRFRDIQLTMLEEFKSRSISLADMAAALAADNLSKVPWPDDVFVPEKRLSEKKPPEEKKPEDAPLPMLQLEWLPAVFSFLAGLSAVLLCRSRIASQDLSMFHAAGAAGALGDDEEEAGTAEGTPDFNAVTIAVRKLLAQVRARQLHSLSAVGALVTADDAEGTVIKNLLTKLSDSFRNAIGEVIAWSITTGKLLNPFLKRTKAIVERLTAGDKEAFTSVKAVRAAYKSSDGASLSSVISTLKKAGFA